MLRHEKRVGKLVRVAIEKLDIDLEGLTVYTEAATGNYAVTAAIAAAANADRVFAIAGDSRHGSVDEAFEQTEKLARVLEASGSVRCIREKDGDHIGRADIVTNTGFVRPIDGPFISKMKETAVIPLMYEPWEFREDDIDIQSCWERGIPVLGTDESDERIATQAYLPHLIAKLSFQYEIEVYNCRYIVVGSDAFASHIVEGLERMGAEVTLVSPESTECTPQPRRGTKRPKSEIKGRAFKLADAIVIADHSLKREIIGPDGFVSPGDVAESNDSMLILHICGNIDTESIKAADLQLVPKDPAKVGSMSFTLGYLGPKPVVDLHAGGLKVGEIMAKERLAGVGMSEVIKNASHHPVVENFSKEFKDNHNYDDTIG